MQIRFGEIRHVQDLARALGTNVEDLEVYLVPANQAALYTTIRIPKRGRKRRGEFRTVYRARQDLKVLQKNIADAIASSTIFDDCVQGFVQKRSIATNARVHLGQRILLRADIHHFFESITFEQVQTALSSLGCIPAIALTLARVCTRDGHLPEGSSSSPVIANLVGRFLDADLKNLAAAHGCRYTRYADDLTFSGDELPDPGRVQDLIARHGFKLRDDECRTQRRGRSQYVTGLTIADTERPHIAKRAKRRLRLELHYAARFGIAEHLKRTNPGAYMEREIKRLGGWVTFMFSVEGPESTRWYYDKWTIIRDNANEEGGFV